MVTPMTTCDGCKHLFVCDAGGDPDPEGIFYQCRVRAPVVWTRMEPWPSGNTASYAETRFPDALGRCGEYDAPDVPEPPTTAEELEREWKRGYIEGKASAAREEQS